jgi:glycosyltransferase involved in cell wall biosynthesis
MTSRSNTNTEVGMSPAAAADVIVSVDRDLSAVLSCLRSVLAQSGPHLRRLLVIDDAGTATDPAQTRALERLAQVDSRVSILRDGNRLGPVEACNLGLAHRQGDAVLLSAHTVATAGWLCELAQVAHSEERTACAVPVSGLGGAHSVSSADDIAACAIDEAGARAAGSGLPRWTTAPTMDGSCIYLRGDMIDAVGMLDPGFLSAARAACDWVMRAQTLGFTAKRANHAYVHCPGSSSIERQQEASLDRSEAVLEERHPQLRPQVESFKNTLDGRLAVHAIQLQATGRLRVAYDLRHLPPENIGTRIYAVNLAKALADLPEIDLSLLVDIPAQAQGLKGRVVRTEEWSDDVAVIHKPAQVFNRHELALLFRSSAHVVITYQDLIAYRVPMVFESHAEFEAYRTTSSLSLLAAGGILAYSENSAREISTEFGIPSEEIAIVPLGVDADWFAHRAPSDLAVRRDLRLPGRYFFSLATLYPHKNLSSLLEAYALLRGRWTKGKPPALVLAGYSIGAAARRSDGMAPEVLEQGIYNLGAVSADELRVLYQHAEALVYPSLYEGFGLPPLEAMAAGTPVVALPFSSVPEVGGDAVLYAERLSAADLARAMERIAVSDALKADLRERGLQRARGFRWEKTARAALEVYRSAVLRPSERSLRMRRLLREGTLRWSEAAPPGTSSDRYHYRNPVILRNSIGIRNAWNALHAALGARLGRELRRFHQPTSRRTA